MKPGLIPWRRTKLILSSLSLTGMVQAILFVWIGLLHALTLEKICLPFGQVTACAYGGVSLLVQWPYLIGSLATFIASIFVLGRVRGFRPHLHRRTYFPFTYQFVRSLSAFVFFLPYVIITNFYLIYNTTWVIDTGLHFVATNSTGTNASYEILRDTYKVTLSLQPGILLVLAMLSIVSTILCYEAFQKARTHRPRINQHHYSQCPRLSREIFISSSRR